MNATYDEFLSRKTHSENNGGFAPVFVPDFLFDFQKQLVEWAVEKGRGAIYADCGLGKTPVQIVFAENIVRKTNGRVLILTPLSVANQTQSECEKFGIESAVSRDGKLTKKIIIANYERLHYFNCDDFEGVICDESSILKNFKGKTKQEITSFMLKVKYRLLCTATAAPNDYIELGTSSECLSYLPYMDMLKMFFKAENNSYAQGGAAGKAKRFNANHFDGKFRFRGHAERDFWRWVCSWARALRKPSDLGFDDAGFTLPDLVQNEHIVKASAFRDGFFERAAVGLKEQRQERRKTLRERCEMAAEQCQNHDYSVAWCNLNDEGDLLEELIPDAVQVAGSDSIEFKEESLENFRLGKIKKLVTKPDIAGFGSNWQHCGHQTFFPSHSFEEWYQAVRRSWRFGQKRPVTIDMVSSQGESNVLKNLQRKAKNAEAMFENLVALMRNELQIDKNNLFTTKEKVPSWL